MERKIVSGLMLTLLFIGMLMLTFNIQSIKLAKASTLTPHSPISIYGNSGFVPDNGVTGGSGTSSDPYMIEDWEINALGGTGIGIQETTAYFIVRNVYVYGGQYGFHFVNVINGKIETSNITNFGRGIYFQGTWGPSQKTTHNSIVNSNISNNGNEGIILFNSDPVLNTFNIISGCNFYHNGYGASLKPAYSPIAAYTSKNHIYHNNFIDNAARAADLTGDNYWDDGYPSGGNYWSDYTGVDVKSGPNQDQPGSDGIGDSPFILRWETMWIGIRS